MHIATYTDAKPTAPVTCQQAEQFIIDNDGAAEWLLRKMANIEAERTRVQAQAAAIVKQLDSDAEGLRFLYIAQLETYCRRKVEQAGGRRKSIQFLQGSCCFRTLPAAIRIADSSAAFRFAQENLPDAVKTVRTLDASTYRDAAAKYLQETREVLPGCESTPERESFSVKFGKTA